MMLCRDQLDTKPFLMVSGCFQSWDSGLSNHPGTIKKDSVYSRLWSRFWSQRNIIGFTEFTEYKEVTSFTECMEYAWSTWFPRFTIFRQRLQSLQRVQGLQSLQRVQGLQRLQSL